MKKSTAISYNLLQRLSNEGVRSSSLPGASKTPRQTSRACPAPSPSSPKKAKLSVAAPRESGLPDSATEAEDRGSGSREELDALKALWPAPSLLETSVRWSKSGELYVCDPKSKSRPIRAVVSDMDGTLLGPDKAVSQRTLETVRKLRSKGVTFIPASGRSTAGMFLAMGQLGDDLLRDGSPFISLNGLTVYGQGKGGQHGDIIYSNTMCPKLATRVVEFWKSHPRAEAAGVSLVGSNGENVVVERLDERTRRCDDWKEPIPKEVGMLDEAIGNGMKFNRIYFWGPSRSAVDSFKDDLQEYLAGYPMTMTRGIAEMIEILPPGASKAVGLEVLLRELSIPADQVLAIGDEVNDITMLEAMGHSVAMGQAPLAVRKVARYTAPTNALDGVAVALETLCGV